MKESLILWFSVVLILIYACGKPSGTNSVSDAAGVVQENASGADTLIFQVALDGDLPRLTELVVQGSNVNFTDKENRTALMYAAFNGHTEMIRFLLEKGADVNLNDVNGRTALMFAASGPFAETVSLLLEQGADINRADFEEHYTALMYAASEGQTDVVRVLLEHHADPLLKDTDGDMAIIFAQNNNHAEVVKLLTPVSANTR